MRSLGKRMIKKILRKFNIDIRRFPEYEKNKFIFLKKYNIKTIIDIGANTGQFIKEIYSFLPNVEVFCFEPLKDVFYELEINLKKLGLKNFMAFNVALGDFNGKAKINRSEFSPSSSLLKMGELHKAIFPFTSKTWKEEITVRRLDDLITEHRLVLKPEILIKLDVQGYEDRVLLGGTDIFKKAKIVITEVSFRSLYEGQPLFDDIYTLFSSYGYRYIGNINSSFDPKTGLPLQSDAIFINETTNSNNYC